MDNLYFNEKRLKKIRNKRSCRTMKIWGWVLTAIGGISMLESISNFSMGDFMDGLLFLIPGVVLLYLAKSQVNKWDRYEALIDNRGNTSISMLAERMKLAKKTVYSDLQKMIASDFFIGPNYNIEAHIDGERDLLVMTIGGRPIKPLPETEDAFREKEEKEAYSYKGGEQARPSEGNWQDDEDAPQAEWKQEPVIKVKMTDLEMIQKAIRETGEEDVRSSLYGIEGSLRRIDGRVQSDPEIKKTGSIRNLYRYYLPQIMELIENYQSEDISDETRNEIKKALHTSAEALGNIEADILEKEQMDIEVDIQVLKNMFAQDGLLRRDMDAESKRAEVRTNASQ